MKPFIAITMGDVCGIGPEIVARLLADEATYEHCHPLVIGDAEVLMRARDIVGVGFNFHTYTPGAELPRDSISTHIVCIDPGLNLGDVPLGQVSGQAGHGAFEFLRIAIELAQNKIVDAIVTAPLNKASLHAGGHFYPGHTEILADLTDTNAHAMMLATPEMKVIHLTTHVGLIEAIQRITPERTYEVIRIAYDALTAAGNSDPQVAVCGINPHAGENGLFGEGEEEQKLVPGIERAQSEGVSVDGPLPADTLFFRAVRGDFDVVVACYHDQGHGPVKVLSLDKGINITLGLNGGIIRTSVDHGTAFDIAGLGVARHESLSSALRYAVDLAPTEHS